MSADATFIPSCVCVIIESGILEKYLALLGWTLFINDALFFGAFFYSLFEIDLISSAWYTIFFWGLFGFDAAFQTAIHWVSPGAGDWFSSCSPTCSSQNSFFYLSTNYYAFPDRLFMTSLPYIILLLKWRSNVGRYIFPSVYPNSLKGAANSLDKEPTQGRWRSRFNSRACYIYPINMAYLLVFLFAYAAGMLVYRKQNEVQFVANVLVGVVIVLGSQIFDEYWRRSLEQQIKRNRLLNQEGV